MFMRNGRIAALALGVTCIAGGVLIGGVLTQSLALGAGTPRPEVDPANATIQLGAPAPLTGVTCLGEDKLASTGGRVPYITYTGSLAGGETESVAAENDYSLTGNLAINNITWTINLNTDRGVFSGKAVLTSPVGTPPQTIYSGKIVLVTQGNPASTSAPTTARGYIVAGIGLPDEGTTPGDDYVLANVEFEQLGLASANGSFGNLPLPTPQVPDFSVVANTPPRGTEAC
jgi:hypothetical protein